MKAQTIIVTGAAMGLGLATAKELAAKGANLALVDYNGESLKAAQSEIEKEFPGAKTIAITADVADESAVRNYVGGDRPRVRSDRRTLQQRCRGWI